MPTCASAFQPDFTYVPPTGSLIDATIGPDLKLWEQRVNVGTQQLTSVAPANVDRITFWYLDKGLRDWDPFWARPWPSGIALASYILENPHLVAGKRILELGAGVGLPSLAAALCGATEVVVTDREPLAIDCMLLSAARNGIPVLADEGSEVARLLATGQIATAGLNAGLINVAAGQASTEAAAAIASKGTVFRGTVLDWSQPGDVDTFDLVLGCDILYEYFQVPRVVGLVKQLTNHEGTLLLAEYPGRYPANLKWFLELMPEQDTLPAMPLVNSQLQPFALPAFVNEMRDVHDDVIDTQFMLFLKN